MSVGKVIGTGLLLGVVHVLTGPDHLSALSTLAVGRSFGSAFGLGVRWGCGHSFGLLIVAIIFFAIGGRINLDKISYYADMFVGFFMVILGIYYIYKAIKSRNNYLRNEINNSKDTRELMSNNEMTVQDFSTINVNETNENTLHNSINDENNSNVNEIIQSQSSLDILLFHYLHII